MPRLAPLDRALAWFPRHARLVLGLALAITAAAGLVAVDPTTGRPRLEVDASSDRLLPQASAARAVFDRARATFGKDETLVVALGSDDVFAAETLERVARLTARLEALPGVERVVSLTNAQSVRGHRGEVEIAPLVEEPPRDAASRAALRREVLDDPLAGRHLVSQDGRTTALLVYFLPMSDREFLDRALDRSVAAAARAEAGEADVWITGGPRIRAETARVLLRETLTLSGGVLLALAAVLALAFREVRGVVLPLVTIAVAVAWTLALAVLRGEPLNALTALVPPLLTALGLSYAVHVVAEVEAEERKGGATRRFDRVAAATRRVALPVGLTGLTTAAGFASLLLSPIPAVREFGALSVVGVLCTMLASLTFTPAALALWPPGRAAGRQAASAGFARAAEALARFDVRHRRAIFAGAALLFALGLAGMARLEVGTRQIGKFPPDAPVRRDFEAVNARLGGANPLYVVVRSQAPGALREPEALREVEALQEWLEAQPEVGPTASLVDFVKVLHQGFAGGDPAERVVPGSRRLVSQLLLFGGGPELDRYVDGDFRMASIHVRTRVVDSSEVDALAQRIEGRLAELPAHLEGAVTGTSVLYARGLDELMRGQAKSLLAAFAIIYAILAGLFVSLRVGLLALIPNALPVVVTFGALGLLGLGVDPGTSLVAPMVLGIAVDDTIHYFARFLDEARRRADEEAATLAALRAVGHPVTVTSAALCAGFLVLTASELRSQVELGALAAFALAVAWATDLVLTPALCARLRVATLWDLLALDLGPEPHRAIALFEGLRPAQARVVALFSELMRLRGGETLFRRGEPGEAVYAVVDGELRVRVAGGGRHVELRRVARGEVVGEVGLLHLARSADVEAVGDARLLRITEASLERLGRRHPRVATVVYRNLSRAAAQRLAQATDDWLAAGAEEPTAPAPPAATAEELRGALGALVDAARGAAHEADAWAPPAEGPASPLEALLAAAGLSARARAAVTLVPLAEMAWADGALHPREREAVEEAARRSGVAPQGLRHLHRWLASRPGPELLEAWRRAVEALCRELSVEARMRLRDALVAEARRVARAAGGIAGVARVSRGEEAALERLAEAFDDPRQA